MSKNIQISSVLTFKGATLGILNQKKNFLELRVVILSQKTTFTKHHGTQLKSTNNLKFTEIR